jgi:ABC-type antimicrobial peptide transport system permease subunit
MFRISLRIAVDALAVHKLRTALTALGMSIGVGAVVTIVALGAGAKHTVSEDVRSAGTNLVRVDAGNFTRGGEESNIASGLGAATTLTVDDADAIGRIAGVKSYAAGVRLRGWVAAGTARVYTQVIGTDVAFPAMNGWWFALGRFFAASDVSAAAPVAVIGSIARDKLFGPDENPIGREIRIRDAMFRVSGIASGSDDDQMDMVFVPYTTLQRVLGIGHLHSVIVAADQAGEATRIAAEIKPLLRARHRLDSDAAMARLRQGGLLGNQMPSSSLGVPDDFTVKTQAAEALTRGLYTSVAAFVLANMPKVDQINLEEMTGTLNRASATMTTLLVAIAAIALFVGGIGIMNVMLVSVNERTHEIGIRRAAGAKRRDVLLQFLVEAVALSCCGGAAGVMVGAIAAAVVTRLLEWPTEVSAGAMTLAFGIAAAIGVFFGFYPARRASLLDPIDALRYE